MTAAKKSSGDKGDLLSRAQNELVKVQAGARGLGCCEIVETIIDSFDTPLFLTQRIILKSIFAEDFDETTLYSMCGAVNGHGCPNAKCSVSHTELLTEQALMDKWLALEKTNWKHPEEVLGDVNMARSLENKSPRKAFTYQNITLQCGMRSSKSSLMGLVAVIRFFKLITSQNPQKEYGIPTSSAIYLTIVASTERQVLGTIFHYVRQYIQQSTFFKTMIASGDISLTELDIEFPAKNIKIASGHSRATSVVGRTALLTLFDELAMFSADDDHTSNAADVYQRVGMSLMTFPNDAQRIALSSVKEQGDFVETLVKDDWTRQDRGCLVYNLTTFDVNPTITRDDSQVASVYDKDQVVAERDFENIRPGVASAFLNSELIRMAAAGNDPQKHVIYSPLPLYRVRGEQDPRTHLTDEERDVLIQTLGPDGFHQTTGLEVTVLPVDWLSAPFSESIGHCDIGLVNDSFAFGTGHAEWSPAGWISVIDVCLEWIPRALGKNKVAKVDMIQADDVISAVCKARRVKELTFDAWNSESSIQRLYREGVMTRSLSFARGQQTRMYDTFKQQLALGLVRIPNHPSLIEELENLMLKGGTAIDHPRKKESRIPGKILISKDLADVCATIVYRLATEQGREFIKGQSAPGHAAGHMSGVRTVAPTQALSKISWKPR